MDTTVSDLPALEEKDDPLRVVGEIDYRKFETITKQEEQAELRQKEEEERKKKMNFCKLDHEHTATCQQPPVMSCAHDHSKERDLFEKPTSEKLKAAELFRNEGNKAYKEGQADKAAYCYRKALLQFDYTFPDTDEEQKQLDRTKLLCHLNLAQCKLQQEDFDEVILQCKQALDLDATNVKAFYRMGTAYMAKDNFVDSKKYFNLAIEVDPNNVELQNGMRKLNKRIREYEEKERQRCSAMFSST
eukprot:GILK01010529.1.p1 GENE.GILK01010529.1~~GILK01010529.1.p1  ORF type:complete len:288 (+),score=71.58 GILK01010529.1:131-865(+)